MVLNLYVVTHLSQARHKHRAYLIIGWENIRKEKDSKEIADSQTVLILSWWAEWSDLHRIYSIFFNLDQCSWLTICSFERPIVFPSKHHIKNSLLCCSRLHCSAGFNSLRSSCIHLGHCIRLAHIKLSRCACLFVWRVKQNNGEACIVALLWNLTIT